MTERQGIDAAAAILGARGRRDVPIGPLTTYRVGAVGRLLAWLEVGTFTSTFLSISVNREPTMKKMIS